MPRPRIRWPVCSRVTRVRQQATDKSARCGLPEERRSPLYSIIMAKINNPFGAEARLATQAGDVSVFRLSKLTESGIGHVDELPFSIKVLLESCLRNTDNFEV